MHEMQSILTDVRGVRLSVCLSVTNVPNDPGSAAARAVYAACRVCGVVRYSLRQMPLASCFPVLQFSGSIVIDHQGSKPLSVKV